MTDYAFQLNVKLGKGYDAHLINIVGNNPDEFKSNLQWVTENAAGVVSAAVALEAAYGVKPLAEHTASVGVTQEQNQSGGQVAQTSPPGPTCVHGQMKYVKAGVSKAGNSYKAFWGCTGPRANQCKSVDA